LIYRDELLKYVREERYEYTKPRPYEKPCDYVHRLMDYGIPIGQILLHVSRHYPDFTVKDLDDCINEYMFKRGRFGIGRRAQFYYSR